MTPSFVLAGFAISCLASQLEYSFRALSLFNSVCVVSDALARTSGDEKHRWIREAIHVTRPERPHRAGNDVCRMSAHASGAALPQVRSQPKVDLPADLSQSSGKREGTGLIDRSLSIRQCIPPSTAMEGDHEIVFNHKQIQYPDVRNLLHGRLMYGECLYF